MITTARRASERAMKAMQIIGAPADSGKLGGPRCKEEIIRFGVRIWYSTHTEKIYILKYSLQMEIKFSLLI